MDVLVLGGTRFLGRSIAETLLARGHRVTLFHRGATLPAGIAGAENVLGDRTRSLAALRGRHWDVAVDTSGTLPAVVEQSLAALEACVARYCYVSSVSVYRDGSVAIDEESGRELPAVDVLTGAQLPADLGPVFGDDTNLDVGRSRQESDAAALGLIGSND